MPMLRKLPKAYRARIISAAADMTRLHGDKAYAVARESAKKARRKHLSALARYWSLVATALARNDALPQSVSPSLLPQAVDSVVTESPAEPPWTSSPPTQATDAAP